MAPNDLAGAVLHKVRAALAKAADAHAAEPDSLSGISFLEQEPDLIKESGLHTRQMSGWAMSGHPTGD